MMSKSTLFLRTIYLTVTASTVLLPQVPAAAAAAAAAAAPSINNNRHHESISAQHFVYIRRKCSLNPDFQPFPPPRSHTFLLFVFSCGRSIHLCCKTTQNPIWLTFLHTNTMSDNNEQSNILPEAPIMRSMMVVPAVPSIPLRAGPLAMESKFQQPRTTKRTSSATTAPAAMWNVDETTLMSLPSIYMLERTHTIVEAPPADVAMRIMDCLRRESISASYNSREVRFCYGTAPLSGLLNSSIFTIG